MQFALLGLGRRAYHRHRTDFGTALLATGLLATAACAPRAAKTVAHPTAPVDIEAELTRNEAALRDAGISVPSAHAPTPPAGKASPEEEVDYDASEDENEDENENAEMDDAVPVSPSPEPVVESYEARSPARKQRHVRAARDYESGRCGRICDLSETTCELAVHICGLAQQHPDEHRYVDACARAQRQCTAADDACQHCESR